MARNLRERLARIRSLGAAEKEAPRGPAAGKGRGGEGLPPSGPPAGAEPDPLPPEGGFEGWLPAGRRVLKRRVSFPFPFRPSALPRTMGFLVPDLVHYAGARGGLMPEPGDLFFFDLETTGLSGGAGTLAFLAGFGRLAPSASSLLVDQYLLLDYPGEDDFIRALLEEFAPPANGVSPLVISFNGKTFDSQILKTRCLMTGRKVPDYFHGDLLHPARRLWKDRLPSCSQSSIETLILGLDRGDDLGGEWAPDIWFDFLRTREAGPLLGICRHNLRDLSGLAAILGVLTEIALDPLAAGEKYRCGNEALAFLWRRGLRRGGGFFTAEDGETGLRLLEKAAAEGAPRSCRILAVEAEWRRRDYRAALFYTERALEGPPGGGALPAALAEDLLRRRDRLLRRLEGRARIPPGAATGF